MVESVEAEKVEVKFAEDPVAAEAAQAAMWKRVNAVAYRIVYFKLDFVAAKEKVGEQVKLTKEQSEVIDGILNDKAFSETDRELALSQAKVLVDNAKPTCNRGCNGRGVLKVVGHFEICPCVVRSIDKQIRETEAKAKIEEKIQERAVTKQIDRGSKIPEAREILARALEAQKAACASVTAQIAVVEEGLVKYFAERETIQKDMDAAQEKQLGYLSEVAAATQEADEQAELVRLAQAAIRNSYLLRVEDLTEVDSERFLMPYRAETRAKAHGEAGSALLSLMAAYTRHDDARCRSMKNMSLCVEQQTLAKGFLAQAEALDAVNEAAISMLEHLRAEHTRIAKHHAPKIDKAERRLKRLEYMSS